ncbi:MAG: peptide ABC transporter substrate-binding protein [Pseudomonadales bacterium]|jgi:oligopeptide transport system substrate-binding protein|nr:peptide ABC transporter substrate-binding protein [Pseudomonadales bacterium]
MPSNVLLMMSLQNYKYFLFATLLCMPFQAWAVNHALDTDTHTVQLALSTEPPNLNSLTSTDSVSFFVLLHTQEGLLSYGDNDTLVGGVAESWQMDGTQVSFTLRDNARWSDGKPVTAQDFLFAWRTALDRATASNYAFILYPIKNAEKVHRGELPPTALGVYADDDRHLRIELEQPTAYFLSLTTFATYYPLREDFYRKQQGRYAADADKLLYNGAFILSQWTHGASLVMEKNPQYWNAANTKLNSIRIPHITNDANTLFNLFQSSEIAFTELSRETLPQALQQRLYIQSFLNGMLNYMEFNFREESPLRNHALREAISLVIDRQSLVNKVIAAPGTRPTAHFFPAWLPGLAPTANAIPAPDIGRAITALHTAEKELGMQVPPLTLLIYDTPSAVRQAEYLQRVLQQTLGIQLIIDKQIFKQKLAKLNSGDFDLALSAWGPDYNDPMTFADLLVSSNANNHGRYRNEKYDNLVMQAATLPPGAARTDTFAAMQTIIQQDIAVLPLTEPGIIYVQNRQLQNVKRSRFGGDPDFRHAYIDGQHVP